MKTLCLMLLAALLLPSRGGAAAPSSQNYSSPADSLDGGGQRVGSPAYTLDGSLGGLGTSLNAGINNHASYPGQLIDVVELTVTALDSNLNEGASLLLTVVARFDDGTYANVTATGARWGATPPLSASSLAPGWITAGSVYQDTLATVEAVYLGTRGQFGIRVLNTQADNFGSYAGDSLDDAWQVQHFGLANPNAAPDLDPDGDGQNNRYEFTVGTTPSDATSRFRLRIDPVFGKPTWKAITFSPRLSNRSYRVEFRDPSGTGGFVLLEGQPITDGGNVRTVTDQTATDEARFYRVRISQP